MGKKSKINKTCYCCDKIGIGREHIPPKGLFPDMRNAPIGYNKFRSLVMKTVPSCDEHNNKKASLDEVFIYQIVSAAKFKNNSAVENIAKKRIKRLVESKTFHDKVFKDNKIIINNGKKTLAFRVNRDNFDMVVSCIASGIYFNETADKILPQRWIIASNIFKNENGGSIYNDEKYEKIESLSRLLECHVQFNSDCPWLFRYFIYCGNSLLIRMVIYDSVEINALVPDWNKT
ncbi:hypothetical protein [Fodinicurvata sp. EGI_FJ10296]|uniref:hypothetical protein n=1 Tax=Fodinicurvata sp. EGI_FJ10296 TaxID=3231908 RepID=UPI003453A2F9